MTVQLKLPKDVEQRLLAEVNAGRHGSLEEAILEKLSRRQEEPDLLKATGLSSDALRKDLDDAWNKREGAIDGDQGFKRIASKSAVLRAQGK